MPPRAARGGGAARLQRGPEPRSRRRGGDPRPSPLARRAAVGRRHELHAGRGGDPGVAATVAGHLRAVEARVSAMTEGRAPVDGGTLHYEVAGDGPGVVLVHPGLWDSRTWDVTFPVFAERHRVLRYDMRGYGRSDRPTGAFSHVEDLRAVMETAGIERAAIVGNSIGGAVAIEFVLEHPEMATALVAIAPGLDGFIATFGEPKFDWDAADGPIEAAADSGDLERAHELEMELWAPLGTSDPA